MQVLPALRAAQLYDYIDGSIKIPAAEIHAKDGDKTTKVVNPEYVRWTTEDQHVLAYLMSSLSREVLSQVVAWKTTRETWEQIEASFTSTTCARSVNTRLALATVQKGALSITEYIAKIKMLADEMAYAGKKLDDEEIVSYIMAGLDAEYNAVVSSVMAQRDPIAVNELYTQLLNF